MFLIVFLWPKDSFLFIIFYGAIKHRKTCKIFYKNRFTVKQTSLVNIFTFSSFLFYSFQTKLIDKLHYPFLTCLLCYCLCILRPKTSPCLPCQYAIVITLPPSLSSSLTNMIYLIFQLHLTSGPFRSVPLNSG